MSLDLNNEYIQRFLNTQYETEEEMIYALFWCARFVYFGKNEIAELLKLKNSTFTEQAFYHESKAMFKAVERQKEYYFEKIQDLPFLRKFVKKMSEHFGDDSKKIGKSKLKANIGAVIMDCLAAMTNATFSDCYTGERLRLLIDALSDEKMIKQEFEEGIIRMIQGCLQSKYPDFETYYEQDEFEILFTNAIALYLVNVEQDKNHIQQAKVKLQQVINYDEGTIKSEIQILNKQKEEYRSKVKQALDTIHNFEIPLLNACEKVDNTSRNVLEVSKNLPSEKALPTIDTLVSENIEQVLDTSKMKTLDSYTPSMKKKYEKYFQYEDTSSEESFNQHYSTTVFPVLLATDNAKPSLILNIIAYLQDSIKEFILLHDVPKDEESQGVSSLIFVLNFLIIWGYCLLSPLNDAEKAELVEQFYEILQKDEKYHKYYRNFQEISWKLPCSAFSPLELYYCQVIATVIFGIDQKPIARKVKNILKKYSGNIQNDLAKANKEQHRMYFEDKNSIYNHLQELAIVFMYDYFLDPCYVASASVFTLYAREILDGPFKSVIPYLGSNYEQLMNNDIQKQSSVTQLKIHHCSEVIEQICEQVEQRNVHEILLPELEMLENLTASLLDTGIDLFLELNNISKLIYRYKTVLKGALFYCDEAQVTKFQASPIEEKIKRVWKWCVYFKLVEELRKMNKYLPDTKKISEEKYTSTLEKSISSLKLSLEEKEHVLATSKNESENLKKSFKDILDKENKKIESTYKKEIHNLKKSLYAKENEIKQLKEQQTELYKLRELMFSLENGQSEIEIEENIAEKLTVILKENSVLLIGGYIKLINKLKKKYPSLKYVHSESTTSFDLLNNADHIFLFYNFMNHSIYNKVMHAVSANSQIKWDYIPYTNFEKTEALIYEKLKGGEEK